MNLRQIEVFRAVMQAGSVTGAARLLGVSQPAVSRLIRYTEDRLGFTLFERRAGRLVATPEAEALHEEAERALQGVRRVGDLARSLGTGRGSGLRIAASPSLGGVLLPRALMLFRQRHPDVVVEVVTVAHMAVLDRVVLRQADLGLSQFAAEHPGVVQEHLAQAPMLLAIPPGAPLARHAVVPLQALHDQPLVSYAEDAPLARLVAAHLARHGVQPRPGTVVRYPMIASFFVEAGIGPALVDSFGVLDRARWQFELRPVDPAPSTALWALHNASRPLAHAARSFLTSVRQVLRDSLPQGAGR